MMGQWGPSAGGMMNGGWGGTLFSMFWIVVLVDLVFLGIWLWRQIQKK